MASCLRLSTSSPITNSVEGLLWRQILGQALYEGLKRAALPSCAHRDLLNHAFAQPRRVDEPLLALIVRLPQPPNCLPVLLHELLIQRPLC